MTKRMTKATRALLDEGRAAYRVLAWTEYAERHGVTAENVAAGMAFGNGPGERIDVVSAGRVYVTYRKTWSTGLVTGPFRERRDNFIITLHCMEYEPITPEAQAAMEAMADEALAPAAPPVTEAAVVLPREDEVACRACRFRYLGGDWAACPACGAYPAAAGLTEPPKLDPLAELEACYSALWAY